MILVSILVIIIIVLFVFVTIAYLEKTGRIKSEMKKIIDKVNTGQQYNYEYSKEINNKTNSLGDNLTIVKKSYISKIDAETNLSTKILDSGRIRMSNMDISIDPRTRNPIIRGDLTLRGNNKIDNIIGTVNIDDANINSFRWNNSNNSCTSSGCVIKDKIQFNDITSSNIMAYNLSIFNSKFNDSMSKISSLNDTIIEGSNTIIRGNRTRIEGTRGIVLANDVVSDDIDREFIYGVQGKILKINNVEIKGSITNNLNIIGDLSVQKSLGVSNITTKNLVSKESADFFGLQTQKTSHLPHKSGNTFIRSALSNGTVYIGDLPDDNVQIGNPHKNVDIAGGRFLTTSNGISLRGGLINSGTTTGSIFIGDSNTSNITIGNNTPVTIQGDLNISGGTINPRSNQMLNIGWNANNVFIGNNATAASNWLSTLPRDSVATTNDMYTYGKTTATGAMCINDTCISQADLIKLKKLI